MCSPNGLYCLRLNEDGNLVFYEDGGSLLWGSYNTEGAPLRGGPQHVEIDDGNLQLVRSGEIVWQSDTPGHPGAVVILTDDGQFQIVHNGVPIWERGR